MKRTRLPCLPSAGLITGHAVLKIPVASTSSTWGGVVWVVGDRGDSGDMGDLVKSIFLNYKAVVYTKYLSEPQRVVAVDGIDEERDELEIEIVGAQLAQVKHTQNLLDRRRRTPRRPANRSHLRRASATASASASATAPTRIALPSAPAPATDPTPTPAFALAPQKTVRRVRHTL